MISIVVPVYNAQNHVPALLQGLKSLEVVYPGRYEIVFVDDCSTDGTTNSLRTGIKDEKLPARIISVHRNVGQVTATALGLANISPHSLVAVTLDDDLQHPVDHIRSLVDHLRSERLDFVVGAFEEQKQPLLRRLMSTCAALIARRTLGTPRNHSFSSFVALDSQFVRDARLLKRSRLEIGWMYRLTNRYDNRVVPHHPSLRTHSNYRLKELMRAAKPLLVHLLNGVVRPLIASALVLFTVSIILSAYYLVVFLRSGELLPGFATLVMLGLINLAVLSLFFAATIRLLLGISALVQGGSLDDIPTSRIDATT